MTKKVLVLRDKRPGHFHQSDGVVKALERLWPVEATQIDLAVPRFPRGRPLRAALRLLAANPARALRLVHGLDLATIARPDVIVSAGADTLAANALLARHFAVPNIFIGSLREVPETAVTAVLTIYPSIAARPRHILTLKPPPFEPDAIAPARPIAEVKDLQGATAALFVGGPSGSHDWSAADWDRLEGLIVDAADELGLSWTLTNSRRTPADASDRLARLAAAHPAVDRFVDIREQGAGSATALFAADILVVTEDSATMLMEAVAARRPVVALAPRERRANRDDEAIDALADARRLARLPLASADGATLARAVLGCEPLAENPLDTLAACLREVLPGQ